jgi:hypothetical protein
MRNSLRSIRGAAAGVVGAGAVAGAMLFGGIPAAQAAPAPAPATTFDIGGPHGGAPLGPGILPERPGGGHGWGGGGHGGWGHGGWGHGGGWGRGWDHGGWGRGWDHGGWGWGNRFWRPWW